MLGTLAQPPLILMRCRYVKRETDSEHHGETRTPWRMQCTSESLHFSLFGDRFSITNARHESLFSPAAKYNLMSPYHPGCVCVPCLRTQCIFAAGPFKRAEKENTDPSDYDQDPS
jgi:hypothetical protein